MCHEVSWMYSSLVSMSIKIKEIQSQYYKLHLSQSAVRLAGRGKSGQSTVGQTQHQGFRDDHGALRPKPEAHDEHLQLYLMFLSHPGSAGWACTTHMVAIIWENSASSQYDSKKKEFNKDQHHIKHAHTAASLATHWNWSQVTWLSEICRTGWGWC